jgi:hypothetical protein
VKPHVRSKLIVQEVLVFITIVIIAYQDEGSGINLSCESDELQSMRLQKTLELFKKTQSYKLKPIT